MRSVAIFISCVLVIELTACAPVVESSFHQSAIFTRDPKPNSCEIPIYRSSEIRRPYQIIGMVQAYPRHWIGKVYFGNPITAMRKEARKVGGDALVDVQIHPTVDESEYRWTGFVIIWRDIQSKSPLQSTLQKSSSTIPLIPQLNSTQNPSVNAS